MNVESILTGIITGVLTGGITGYLAALHAMRQFRAQRAFDRQLEWYERTVRALGTLSHLSSARFNVTANLTEAFEEFKKGEANEEQCVEEAVLYAEQSSYEHLQEMQSTFREIKWRFHRGDPISVQILTTQHTVLNNTLIELTKPVRKMLGLKKLALKAPQK